MWSALLLSTVGPLLTTAVKKGLSKLSLNPKASVLLPFAHLGLQLGGAWVVTKAGVNPFEGMDLSSAPVSDPVVLLGAMGTAGGNIAYGAWDGLRR